MPGFAVAGVQADPTSRLVAVCRPISGGDTVFPQSAEELVIIEGEAFSFRVSDTLHPNRCHGSEDGIRKLLALDPRS